MKILIVLITICFQTLFAGVTENETNFECRNWSQSHLKRFLLYPYANLSKAIIEFETMEQLNIKCESHLLIEQKVYLLGLEPTNKHFLLDFNFDIRSLTNSISFIKNDAISVFVHNINGFTINQDKKHTINQSVMNYTIHEVIFDEAKFDFYLNDARLITPDLCVRSNFEHSFSNFGEIVRFENAYYSRNVCPYVFMNTSLKSLSLYQISNSFIYKNQFEFLTINETERSCFFSPDFQSLDIQVYYIQITSKLINKNLFSCAEYVYLQGVFYDIQEDLFDLSFKKLKMIEILPDSMEVVFGHGIKWIRHLNNDLHNQTPPPLDSLIDPKKKLNESVDLSRAIYVIFFESDEEDIFKRHYFYPDKDICAFKDFPHKQLVAPLIPYVKTVPCTCTILWLIQYVDVYKNVDSFINAEVSSLKLVNETACIQELNCNFTQMFKYKCFDKTMIGPRRELSFFEDNNFFFNFKILKYIVEIYLQPCFFFISILTNALVLIVLRNNTSIEIKKSLSNTMYSHIQVNSAFNIMYALIKIASLVNICILPRTSFCSQVFKQPVAQYFKIYVVYFWGNTALLAANTSYICFSISRYFLTTSINPSRFFNTFKNLNLKRFYSLVFLACLCISSFKIFQFKINDFGEHFALDYPFDKYGINYCQMEDGLDVLKLIPLKVKCQLFSVINMFNNILNNMLFLSISILIDVSLIGFTKQNLERKRLLFAGGENQREVNQAIKLKEKITKLIITNGLLYFVSHMPDFVVTLFFLVLEKKLKYTCQTRYSCLEMIDIVKSFNLISMVFQFFVFKHFDKNFRNSLNNLRKKKEKKILI